MKLRPYLLAALVAVSTVGLLVDRSSSETPPAEPWVAVIRPVPDPLEIHVSPVDDEGKPGTTRSVMVQRFQTQAPNTSGPSPDTLRVVFDAPVRLLGLTLSVDIWGPSLVEFAVGIGTPVPYGLVDEGDHEHRKFVARDWLLHASDSNGGNPSKIDETTLFGDHPFELEAGEFVALDAWLGNQTPSPTGVSPEMILFYEWVAP